jgi:hypothetical protein
MVLFFYPRGHETSRHFIYMGRDKVENEELIAHGWPEDVWCAPQRNATQRSPGFVADAAWRATAPSRFHVDRLSSAHVYMRLAKGETVADISKEARACVRSRNAMTTVDAEAACAGAGGLLPAGEG